MPAGQGDEQELVAHLAELALELGDGLVVQCRLPVERRRAVVGQHFPGELGVYGVGELLGLVEVGCPGLTPDEVAVRGIGQGAGDGGGHAGLGVEEALGGALASQEWLVAVVHVAGDERGSQGIGPGDDHRRHAEDVGGQAGRGQRPDVLLGRDEHLAAHVAALLL